MSTKKKSSAKSGKWNSLITIQLCREEYEALEQIAKKLKPKSYQTTGDAADFVLNIALMNWDKLEPHIYALQKYARDEGFSNQLATAEFRAKTIARKFKLRGIIHPKREVAK